MYLYLSESTPRTIVLPPKGDIMAFSSVKQLSRRLRFRGFSVKQVYRGEERYTINDHQFSLTAGSYLLANNSAEGYVNIDSEKPVEGVCLDIDVDTLSSVMHEKFGHFPDKELGLMERLIFSSSFEPQLKSQTDTQVSRLLKQCEFEMHQGDRESKDISQGFYFEMSEAIIHDHLLDFSNPFFAKKKKTGLSRTDIYRLKEAKHYMDDHFVEPLLVADIAMKAEMTEFRFYREFKNLFGESPYRYLLKKRLWYSQFLLRSQGMTVTQTAFETGFADIYAFSKAYKRFFSESPSSSNR